MAMGIMSLLMVLVGTLCMLSVSAQLSATQKNSLLRRHNDLRRSVHPRAANMLELRWDERLARVAQSYSQRCSWDRTNPHNKQRTTQFHGIGGFTSWRLGENIALHTMSDQDSMVEHSMQAFFNERADYNFATRKCLPGKVCGHYTQLAWAKTEAVGCGVYRCPRIPGLWDRPTFHMTCNYGPAGNFNGEKPYISGSQCSRCPASAPYCNQGLCSSRRTGSSQPSPRVPAQPAQRAPAQSRNAGSATSNALQRTVSSLVTRVRAIEGRLRRASAHLEGGISAVSTLTSDGPVTFWNPKHSQSHMEGGFRYANGELTVPVSGKYFVYSQLWNAEKDGQRVRHHVYVGGQRLAAGGATDGTSQSTSTSGVYKLNAGQRISVRVFTINQKGVRHVWAGADHSWFGAFMI